MPYIGGWVEIIAENESAARGKFMEKFPRDGGLNCAFVYSEDEFSRTKMSKEGNWGYYCHEVIE